MMIVSNFLLPLQRLDHPKRIPIGQALQRLSHPCSPLIDTRSGRSRHQYNFHLSGFRSLRCRIKPSNLRLVS